MNLILRKQRIFKERLSSSKNVDVAFLIDCTSSMEPYIQETKRQINSLLLQVQGYFGGSTLRAAFVGYRDFCDGDERLEVLQLTDDLAELQDFVALVEASGGGDTPEDVLGGLQAALDLEWSAATRVIIHVGDAPNHGRRLHDLGASKDDYYTEGAGALDAESVLADLRRINCKYFFGKINDSTDKMFQLFSYKYENHPSWHVC